MQPEKETQPEEPMEVKTSARVQLIMEDGQQMAVLYRQTVLHLLGGETILKTVISEKQAPGKGTL